MLVKYLYFLDCVKQFSEIGFAAQKWFALKLMLKEYNGLYNSLLHNKNIHGR